MTSAVTSAVTQTSVRRLPVPVCEPPFDDEVPGHGAHPSHPWPRSSGGHASEVPASAMSAGNAVQGTLALSFVLPTGVPSTPVAPPGLRLLPTPFDHPDAEHDLDLAEFGPQPTGRARLPEPAAWAGRFAQAVVEVLAGDRPLAQLVRWTSRSVYDEVGARIVPRTVRDRGGAARGVVRSVHVSEPDDGVAEVAALVRCGQRTSAVALRLEGLDGRWQCTALELG